MALPAERFRSPSTRLARTITFTTPDTSDLTGNTFTYTVSNGSGTSTATVNVGVMQVNTGGRVTRRSVSPDLRFFLSLHRYRQRHVHRRAGHRLFLRRRNNDTYRFAFTGSGNDQINESILGGRAATSSRSRPPLDASFTSLNFQRVDADAEESIDDLLITYNGQSITVVNDQFDRNHGPSRLKRMSFNGGTFAGYSLGTGPYNIDDTSGGNDIVAGTIGNDILNSGRRKRSHLRRRRQ